MSANRRIALLDEIRGLCILCMVFYHAFYLFGSLLNWSFCMRLFLFFEPLQLLFASAFICISGICTNLSRSVLRRSALLCALATAVSVITIVLLPKLGYDTFQDRFGILHLLGVCMLLSILLRKPLSRIPARIGMTACVVLYVVFWTLCRKTVVQTPYLFPLGFRSETFYSADYFPLLPHSFVFFFGVWIGMNWQKASPPEWVYRNHVPPLCTVGRYTLWIYLLHVPVILLCIKFIERIYYHGIM